jgi:hypothetical protein
MNGRGLIAYFSFLQHATNTTKGPRRYTQRSYLIELYKHPSRSARNLSERFRTLEKMLLAKHNLSQAIADAPQPLTSTPPSTSRRPSTAKTFRGFVIPEVPKPPEPDGASRSFSRPTPPLFLTTCRRMLHVWLCRLRARLVSRLIRCLQSLRGVCSHLSHRYESTNGTMARDPTFRTGGANASSGVQRQSKRIRRDGTRTQSAARGRGAELVASPPAGL